MSDGNSMSASPMHETSSEASFQSAQSALESDSNQLALPPMLRLPSEVLHHILSFLECQHLVALFRTCHRLKELAEEDLLWVNLLHKYIPAQDFPTESPYPAPTYRRLYQSHHPYWFLPKYKIWMSDEPLVGKLMICKYDPRRGCIEGYRLLADPGPVIGSHWPYKPSVLIHSFAPEVHMWMDDPVLNLPYNNTLANRRQGWWEGEITMTVGHTGHNTAASFFLALDLPEQGQAPSTELWPPRNIPNMPRVRASSGNRFMSQSHKPQTHDQISQTSFRMRHWSQFLAGLQHYGIRVGEEVSTWSTLDPSLYTPTKAKPYQGIFVGDYAGHGCEFLLVIQTEKAPPPPPPSDTSDLMQSILRRMEQQRNAVSEHLDSVARAHIESQPPVPPNLDDDDAHSGSLEAIKLTGDPHVPRGEHTFIADDIGSRGLLRIAVEQPFTGARVVRSRGHVAAEGFENDGFIPSQLILVSPDRLAHYWEPLGHISYYERVNLDQLLA